MIDNCSTTARLGARKWAPRFDYILDQLTVPKLNAGDPADSALLQSLRDNPIHEVLAKCSKLRPSVDIAVLE